MPVMLWLTARGSRMGQRPESTCAQTAASAALKALGSSMLMVWPLREFQCGDWWIGTKSGRSGYFRCKLDGRQVVRISLGTRDLDEAKEWLTSWFLRQQQGPPPDRPVSLAEVLLAYNEGHGKGLASAADVKISSRLWADYFGDLAAVDACDVGHPLTVGELRQFYAALREPHVKRFFILGIGTGARPDAISALGWS